MDAQPQLRTPNTATTVGLGHPVSGGSPLPTLHDVLPGDRPHGMMLAMTDAGVSLDRRAAEMHRRVAGLLGGAAALSLMTVVSVATPAGASGISLKVSPEKGLSDGQVVKVSGSGLPVTTKGKKNSFFLDECNSAVTGQLSLADEPHCDVSVAKALTVSKKGSFKTSFQVATGKVGDGSCGIAGHLSCVIGVGDTGGQGAVADITFK
jgi:hypothetical protein